MSNLKISSDNTATVREARKLLTDASRLIGQLSQTETDRFVSRELSDIEDRIDAIRHQLYEMQSA